MKAAALLQAGVLALTSSFLAANVSAAVINVDNASFEILPAGGLPNICGTDCSFSNDAIPGWFNDGVSGQFQPGNPATTFAFDSLSDGPTNAYSNGGIISQMVVPTVQVGVVYTLLVDIGARKDTSPAGTAALLINGIQYTATGVALPGAFTTFTATYTGLQQDEGLSITVVLLSSGAQGNFDNVRLSNDLLVNPTGEAPEPNTLAMLGLGLTAIGVLRRKFAA